jgi:hypothetical protein
MKRGILYAAAAMTVVGGSVLALGAHTWNEEMAAEEVAMNAQSQGVDKDVASGSSANAGTENYWGRGGWGGRGYGGRGWGWGGRGWGRGYGYRGGRWGYWGPSYYGYSCADGWYYCR